jgi:hypothetical protein
VVMRFVGSRPVNEVDAWLHISAKQRWPFTQWHMAMSQKMRIFVVYSLYSTKITSSWSSVLISGLVVRWPLGFPVVQQWSDLSHCLQFVQYRTCKKINGFFFNETFSGAVLHSCNTLLSSYHGRVCRCNTSAYYLSSKKCVFKSIIKTVLVNSTLYKDSTRAVESCVQILFHCVTHIYNGGFCVRLSE